MTQRSETLKSKLLVALAAGSALALTACSGGSAPTAPSEDGELTPVTVAVIPIADTAALWLGVDQGFFEDEGLDVTIDTAGGGAAIVPGVVSGDYDFGFSNYISLYVANDKGLDLQVVANGVTAGEDAAKDFGGVVVLDDSDVKTPADLAGKTVSVNTLANIGDTTIRSIVAEDGGDAEAVDFVEIGFPDAPAALENGQIDAAWIVEPFLTQAVAAGARVVTYNFSGFDPELDVSGYFTSGAKATAEPEVVEAFQRAMNISLEFANENADEVRAILASYTTITPEVIEKIALPRFRAAIDADAAKKLAEAAVKYSGLSKMPNLDEILP
jgi:NitT/TauT family transport system substrate-binding protein